MTSSHDGNLDVRSDMTVTGTVTGSITVHPGAALVLLGVAEGGVVVAGRGFARIRGITHGLFVAVGGHAALAGTCLGDAVNDGGDMSVEGIVTGDVRDNGGITRLRSGSAAGRSGPLQLQQGAATRRAQAPSHTEAGNKVDNVGEYRPRRV